MLLELQSVSREFAMNDGRKLHAVNEVDLAIAPGEGAGPGASPAAASPRWAGCARGRWTRRAARSCSKAATSPGCRPPSCALRRSIQFIYQDPHSALNPRMTILRSVSEPLIPHTDLRGARLRARGRADGDGGLPAQFSAAIRTNCPGAEAARASPAPSRSSPGCWCWTNPPRRWMYRCRRRSWAFKDLQERFQLSIRSSRTTWR